MHVNLPKSKLSQEAARILKEKLETETREMLNNVIELMRENASDQGVTLFMPHVTDFAFKKTSEAAKWLSLLSRTRKIIQISPEIFETLNRYLENPIDEDVSNYLYEKDILAVLWSVDRADTEKMLSDFVKYVSEPQSSTDDEGNRVSGDFQARLLDPLIIQLSGDNDADIEPEDVEMETDEKRESRGSKEILTSKRSSESSKNSNERNYELSGSEDPEVLENVLTIPPVWTPLNKEGNALLMFYFFSKVSFQVSFPSS